MKALSSHKLSESKLQDCTDASSQKASVSARTARAEDRFEQRKTSGDGACYEVAAERPYLLARLAFGWPFNSDWYPLAILLALYLIASGVAAPSGL